MAKRSIDELEEAKVTMFISKGCGCSLGPHTSNCISRFDKESIEEHRMMVQELDPVERDLVLMSFFHYQLARDTDKLQFQIHGQSVCRATFLFLFNISEKLFYTLRSHYKSNGLVSRIHGNKNRLPANTHTLDTNQHLKKFIENYAEEHAVILPGRIPGYRDDRIQLIQSSENKKIIHKHYVSCCEKTSIIAVSYSRFCSLWNELLPYVVVAKPLSDLCWTCQNGNNLLMRSGITNGIEDHASNRSDILQKQLDHIKLANEELNYYRMQCQKASDEKKINVEYSLFKEKEPCTFDGVAHYSWDYAQQLHYPQNPEQPGPIYFKTARKCGIFGICNDGFNFQYNYLIDEIVSTGKGSNSTISYVHHFLANYGMGEKNGLFHADNCAGINR